MSEIKSEKPCDNIEFDVTVSDADLIKLKESSSSRIADFEQLALNHPGKIRQIEKNYNQLLINPAFREMAVTAGVENDGSVIFLDGQAKTLDKNTVRAAMLTKAVIGKLNINDVASWTQTDNIDAALNTTCLTSEGDLDETTLVQKSHQLLQLNTNIEPNQVKVRLEERIQDKVNSELKIQNPGFLATSVNFAKGVGHVAYGFGTGAVDTLKAIGSSPVVSAAAAVGFSALALWSLPVATAVGVGLIAAGATYASYTMIKEGINIWKSDNPEERNIACQKFGRGIFTAAESLTPLLLLKIPKVAAAMNTAKSSLMAFPKIAQGVALVTAAMAATKEAAKTLPGVEKSLGAIQTARANHQTRRQHSRQEKASNPQFSPAVQKERKKLNDIANQLEEKQKARKALGEKPDERATDRRSDDFPRLQKIKELDREIEGLKLEQKRISRYIPKCQKEIKKLEAKLDKSDKELEELKNKTGISNNFLTRRKIRKLEEERQDNVDNVVKLKQEIKDFNLEVKGTDEHFIANFKHGNQFDKGVIFQPASSKPKLTPVLNANKQIEPVVVYNDNGIFVIKVKDTRGNEFLTPVKLGKNGSLIEVNPDSRAPVVRAVVQEEVPANQSPDSPETPDNPDSDNQSQLVGEVLSPDDIF